MVTLNPIFANGMVMQAGKPARIFGTGTGKVSIDFLGQVKSVVANGEWLIEFEPQAYGGPYEMTACLDGEKKVINDIWFGDVYLLSGQSNMQFKMWRSLCQP